MQALRQGIMENTQIGLLGFGTVGQGVLDVVNRREGLHVAKALVRHPENYQGKYAIPFTSNPDDILSDPDIDVIVEVMGGLRPAYDLIVAALGQRKSVVTANKAVVARYGPELMSRAREARQNFLFEASVGGGIPVLDALSQHLSTVPIHVVEGVVNGTTNFILDQMDQGMSYHHALERAQALGFAEQDPSADVDGWDSARKLTILAGLAFHAWVDAEEGIVEGIRQIDAEHLTRLRQMGFGMRLVARAERHPGSIGFVVAPTVYPQDHRYLQLHGSQNAIGFLSEAGWTWIEGPGAGGIATATSIVADIQRIRMSVPDRNPLFFSPSYAENVDDAYFIFMDNPDKPLPHIADALRSGPGFIVAPHKLPEDPSIIQYRYRAK
ncbi:MAG: homoserine dehydrogenase [Sulfobacillus thermosulfidooxidans]|uniref:homoserine dehydrogenase n=1 Tax=Sulfobacillus TaxID=28033 RepID=UPI000CD22017|nr:homoserine dehydrogenase [Sulfobacillus sp. hq2]POB11624.1 homoserine dehydrogenase [Sulfobacillus sp. hq2]PSR32564.1 MAG: homoserine dehydrogenase [Sulfobacillus thermosulfidooxidans]